MNLKNIVIVIIADGKRIITGMNVPENINFGCPQCNGNHGTEKNPLYLMSSRNPRNNIPNLSLFINCDLCKMQEAVIKN